MIQTRDHEMSTEPDPQNTPSVGFQNDLRCNFRPIFFYFGKKIHFYNNFLAMHCFSLDSISLYFTFSLFIRDFPTVLPIRQVCGVSMYKNV